MITFCHVHNWVDLVGKGVEKWDLLGGFLKRWSFFRCLRKRESLGGAWGNVRMRSGNTSLSASPDKISIAYL
jgi:hypothetical protein